ncbi:MEDS domain-containing protein [Lentzea sp. NPDC060358]|uniref:MEDS domain-containing protein n=1 Tax=Lentzea sp. NPDC060358 TaxID=3347103 RepID=UPI003654E442
MRRSGVVEHVRGFGPHDHVCWRYDEHAQFVDRAAEFLADGLLLGQAVRYISTGDADQLRAELAGSEVLGAALRDGSAQVTSLDDVYPVGTVIDPVAQVRAYAAATDRAVLDGFTGLRVAADCTVLVGSQEQRAAFARYEHLADRYMAAHPFSALCAYDSGRLPAGAIEQVACMHPNTNADGVRFRLHGTDRAGCAAALGGEVDSSSRDSFARALDLADPLPVGGELVIDATGLTFLDHNGLLRLSAHARRHDSTLVLHTRWPGAARLVRALDLADVRVEKVS